MKIAVADQVNKFTSDLIQHWTEQGHEVQKQNMFNPRLVDWADITFFDFCEGSVQRASNPEDQIWKDFGKPQPLDKNIICRLHDIDIWAGGPSIVKWGWVNHAIFVSDYMRKICGLAEGNPNPKIHVINHGINLNKFTFKEHSPSKKIAWVGNICQHKCLELALQVLAENPDYELHVVGDSHFATWENNYIQEFVNRNNLKYFYSGKVPNINEWLEDKDYMLLTSFKEAFSFIVGESMAKGIKPLIHNFPGAEDVWDKKYIWNKISEIRPMLEGEYHSEEYRNYVAERYSLDKMFSEYDKVLFGS